MKNTIIKTASLISSVLLVSACQQQAELAFSQHIEHQNYNIESVQLLKDDANSIADRLVNYENKGLALEDNQGRPVSLYSGNFGPMDYRATKAGLLIAAEDKQKQQVFVTQYVKDQQQWLPPVYLPKTDFKVEGLCLYQKSPSAIFAFLVGEEGQGEQWLVSSESVVFVRKMSLPPNSEYCQVNDHLNQLFVNEEGVGLWAYPTDPEADLTRDAVAMVEPYGSIKQSVAGIALVNDDIVISDPEQGEIQHYQHNGNDWTLSTAITMSQLSDAEVLSIRQAETGVDLAVVDDAGMHLSRVELEIAPASTTEMTVSVPPAVQTDPVPNMGDAADDPAIWFNPANPEQSRIIGTDKKGGLAIYDLSGNQVQYLNVGRLNNVDLRSGFEFDGREVALITASNRDHNSLHVFYLEPSTGNVVEAGQLETESKDIYGLCMFKDQKNRFSTIVNDKDGTFLQYEITANQQQFNAELKRKFNVSSQPEGCVADDNTGQLFIGEEDKAIWTLDANVDAPATLTLVHKAEKPFEADIEGMSIYQGKTGSYLVVSSQGNNRYVVLDTQPPYKHLGTFSVGMNAEKGIDGASETDGLAVSSHNFGGIWQQGMLVVQDGRNRMPATNQNYKYISWSDIAAGIGLNE